MKKIKLNQNEFDYLLNSIFLPKKDKSYILSEIEKKGRNYFLTIEEDKADEFRDLFGEQLQIMGFDEKYELTSEGKTLESLIDKFFCG